MRRIARKPVSPRTLTYLAAALLATTLATGRSHAQVLYQYDDGQTNDAVGISGGTIPYDIIWLNRFPVQPGGEVIARIRASFGRPLDPNVNTYNGRAVTALLYEDTNGGSTTDAVLRASVPGTIQNAGVIPSAFVDFDIPDTLVNGNFLVGILARNVPQGSFLAAVDLDTPVPGVSFAGFTIGTPLNENNLASIPAGQYGAIESFGLPSQNWLVRAEGIAVPEPGSLVLVGLAATGGLGWLRRRATKKPVSVSACLS